MVSGWQEPGATRLLAAQGWAAIGTAGLNGRIGIWNDTIEPPTSDGVAIFGSWTKAMDAACPFSEVTHLPLFGTLNGVRVQVHSLQWDEDNREDMPSLLIARMISFDWPHDEQWDAAQDSYWIRSKAAFSLPIKFNAQENARSQANAKCN